MTLPTKTCLLLAAVLLAACAPDPAPAFRSADDTVFARTGHHIQWNRGTPEDRQVDAALRQLLASDLTADSAVEIALLNNAGLQSTFEQIGIAQADLVQAGLLHNPEFFASWRFPDRAPHQTDAEYSVSADFLELLILPLRQHMAAAALRRAQAQVADSVLQLAADVKVAFYTTQAQQQLLDRDNLIADITLTAATLAESQHTAGTNNDLDLANQRLLAGQARIDAAKSRIELTESREKLNRLLGLWGQNTTWKIAPLADVPEAQPSLEHLESLAISQRLDLAAARQSIESLGESLHISEDFRYLATMKIGVDTEHNIGGPNVTGPTLDLELPIFDQGQARIATAQAQYRQAREDLIKLAVDIRSQTREARDRLIQQHELALLYQKTLLPQHAGIVNLTQLQYNTMLKSTFDLLTAKQNQITAEQAAIEATRDYWIARAQLEQAVGGRLSDPTTQPAATEPSTQSVTQPATQPDAK